MRDESWLASLLHEIWDEKFSHVKKKNNVVIRWKGKWKNKFGHIKMLKNGDSEIGINALFQDERVPEYVVRLTIAHEIIHYMHGFHSPHQKKFKHPHKGGIVNMELKKIGFGEELAKEKRWFKESWLNLYNELTNNGFEERKRNYNTSIFRFF
ncbi:MAG: SprT-like domain-containing protein [Nanoarchaeota archaeon]